MKILSCVDDLKYFIREVEDYPKKGVSFKDISPLLADPRAFNYLCDKLSSELPTVHFNSILGIEARGFIMGSVIALMNNASFVMVRKAKKLIPDPSNTIRFESANEYGTEMLGLNLSFINPKGGILIHDDIFATGGTALSVYKALISKGYLSENIYFSFLIELSFLGGKEMLTNAGVDIKHISSLIKY